MKNEVKPLALDLFIPLRLIASSSTVDARI